MRGFRPLDHSCGGKMVHGKIRNSLWAVYERSKALYLGSGKYRERQAGVILMLIKRAELYGFVDGFRAVGVL